MRLAYVAGAVGVNMVATIVAIIVGWITGNALTAVLAALFVLACSAMVFGAFMAANFMELKKRMEELLPETDENDQQ